MYSRAGVYGVKPHPVAKWGATVVGLFIGNTDIVEKSKLRKTLLS